MNKLNVNDPSISEAIKYLGKHREITKGNLSNIFEEFYHCRIISTNEIHTTGYIYFPKEEDKTWFLLKFS